MAIKFDTKTCGRCGGSGKHSYNQMHGDVCYGCQGTGIVWTTAGKKARIALAAKQLEVCGVPVETLQPGQKFRDRDNKWRTVVEVSMTGGSRWLDKKSGEWRDYVNVLTQKAEFGFFPGDRVVLVSLCNEKLAEMTAFAKSLKGCTVTEAAV